MKTKIKSPTIKGLTAEFNKIRAKKDYQKLGDFFFPVDSPSLEPELKQAVLNLWNGLTRQEQEWCAKA